MSLRGKGDGSSGFSSRLLLQTNLLVFLDLDHFRIVDRNHYRSIPQPRNAATISEAISGLIASSAPLVAGLS